MPADEQADERARGLRERIERMHVLTAVLKPAVVTFAARQVETAMLEYDRNPWVKKLANRGAQMEMTWSGREQVMLPYSSMPASASSRVEERINWMLAFCRWNEPEMEELVKQLQEALLPLKRAKEAALQVQRDAVHALHAALHQMPDEHASALSAAVCSKTFCAIPSELSSLLLNDRWLDHAVSLEHNSSLPAPRGLGSREILQWACTLQPHHITSSWLHDGASPLLPLNSTGCKRSFHCGDWLCRSSIPILSVAIRTVAAPIGSISISIPVPMPVPTGEQKQEEGVDEGVHLVAKGGEKIACSDLVRVHAAEEIQPGHILSHFGSTLAAPPTEQPRAQMRRIICRMVGDLIQPWVFRSGNRQPWAPDFAAASGRVPIRQPSTPMPPQCDVGFSPSAPVTWRDVLVLLPELGSDAVLDHMEALIRARACLLRNDTLVLVNLGPQMACPIPTPEPEYVRHGTEEKASWRMHPEADSAPVTHPPNYGRVVHVMIRQAGLRPGMDRRILMQAPHARPSSSDELGANVLALRAMFNPALIAEGLMIVTEFGMESLRQYREPALTPSIYAIHNSILARQRVIAFLNEACDSADYQGRLTELLQPPTRSFTWEDVFKHAGLGQQYIQHLIAHWSRIPLWVPGGELRQHRSDSRFFDRGPSLKFRPPTAAEQYDPQVPFLKSLLQEAHAVMVPGHHAQAFWR